MAREIDAAIEAARAAGKILMQNFGKGTTATRKSAKEFVTPIDIECEEKIISILQRDFPDYGIWSEEMEELKSESDYRWIADPVDGTHNFFYGLPLFGISIALERKGRIECGAILLPAFNELFTAESGNGAFLNGKQIHVSSRGMDDAAIFFCKNFLDSSERMEKLKQIASKALTIRACGASVFHFSSVAAGRMDALIGLREHPWDFAAGWLLVEEAGGKFTKLNGGKFTIDDSSYIASNGLTHGELVKIMGGVQ